MKLFKTLLCSSFLLLSFGLYAQKNTDAEKIIQFNTLVNSLFNKFTMESVQFNTKALMNADLNTLKISHQQLKNNTENSLKQIKSAPLPTSDSSLQSKTLHIFKRLINKISGMDPLFTVGYTEKDLNKVILAISLQNMNLGKESNQILQDYNKAFKTVADKYGLKVQEKAQKLLLMEQYNNDMDYINKYHVLYMKTIIGYNDIIEAINSQDSSKIRTSRLAFSKQLDTLNRGANAIKKSDDSLLSVACINLLKTNKRLCQNEISQVQRLFTKGLKTNAEVNKVNDLVKIISDAFNSNKNEYDKQLIEFNNRAVKKLNAG